MYNAKNDQFLSGVSMWSVDELEKMRQKRFDRPSTTYSFDSGKTEDKRMNLMDIDASLKLSFLGEFDINSFMYGFLEDPPEFCLNV